MNRYAGVLERFKAHLGKKADRDLASLKAVDVGGFRDALSKDLSRNSPNLSVKTLRVCLRAALRARDADEFKQRGEARCRPFILPEIQRVLKAAVGSEWYGMTLAGL